MSVIAPVNRWIPMTMKLGDCSVTVVAVIPSAETAAARTGVVGCLTDASACVKKCANSVKSLERVTRCEVL